MKNTAEIYIIGAGTYGEVMCELAEILGYRVMGFFDENVNMHNKVVMNKYVLGKFTDLEEHEITDKKFIVAIGDNSVRNKIMRQINQHGGITPTLIHPTAIISPSSKIGKGVYIQANAYVWTRVIIDDFCIISPNVVIAHHSIIGKACLISTLSSIGASIEIKDKVFVGMGSTIVTGVTQIEENTIIGAGAVVLMNTEKDSKYVGVPAKRLGKL